MPRLYLPADHTDADLVLAGQIAERMESTELFVAWSPTAGVAAPEVPALLREPVSPWAETLGLIARAIAELWVAVTTRRPAAPPRPVLPPATGADGSRPHPAAGEPTA
jgi:hypothetical protein